MEQIFTEIISKAPVYKAVIIALIMIIGDLATGFVKAFYMKDFKSSIAKKGLWEKSQWIIIIMIGYSVYYLLEFSVLVYAMVIACCITEFMSILENARDCGIQLDIMKYLRDGGNND